MTPPRFLPPPPGELYHAFTPENVAHRRRCEHACRAYNNAGDVPRRQLVRLWRDINLDERPLPPQLPDPAADEALFEQDPWIEPPIRLDYGTNLELGDNVYINFE
ncbi:hypothetical protein MMC25_004267 [Agyrium rufum]|nr:hypothetical protein [Agyrium rufum]